MVLLKNKYGEIRSGWAIALSLAFVLLIQFLVGIVIAVIAATTAGPEILLDSQNSQAYQETVVNIVKSPPAISVSYSVMIAALLLMFYLLYKRPLRQMGFYVKSWGAHLALGGVFGIVNFALALTVLLVFGAARLENVNINGLAQADFWLGLVKYVFVGFFEEILSRGLMMTALKTTRNKAVILLAPALVFGLMHATNPNVTFFSLVNISLVGVLFAYLFIKTGRLWASIGFHITWNFVQGYIFGVPVSGTGVPGSAAMMTLFTGPDWLTGGAFGVEGGAACTLMIILGLFFIHFCVKSPEHPEDFWRMDGDLPLTRGGERI